ncbi:CAP domain-containing protein [Bacillus massiliigorillae]|uniref:CAP domain-containing protein n=1 Tax=Bacillus massiliigorillae TaxID=1243664 RepID=UPI0003A70339|nr:CAP domain-containing protein [Bacillus massiliigorillae]
MCFLATLIFIISIYYFHEEEELLNKEQSASQIQNPIVNKKQQMQQNASEGLSLLIGKSSKEVMKQFGEPSRKDPSPYGYEWWIYSDQAEQYMQVGVENGQVVSVYGLGKELNIAPFAIGQPIDQLFQSVNLETTIDIDWKGNSYRFELSEEDLGMRPLVKLGNGYAQVYIDKFTGEVSSVRFLNVETLIKQRPYELVYRGELPEEEVLSAEKWKLIQDGDDQQIFDITNIIRKRFDLDPVEWDEATAIVAYKHSMDMFKGNYFSHESPQYGDLGNRLKKDHVKFELAGENIAAQYVDGVAAFEGWLNSKGHREALLNKEFTHLGVGVYQKYYTQNFIKKP